MPASPTHAALYTAAQVRALDRCAIDVHGIPGYDLMQRAAWAAWNSLRRRWPDARRVLVLCGPGNNGGDGFLLARLARMDGFDARVLALPGVPAGDAARARAAAAEAGVPIDVAVDGALPEADVYVDALYGTGLTRAIDGVAADLIRALAPQRERVLALDVPSGLSADTGNPLGPAVVAAATISFVAWKRGLYTAAAVDQCGALELATLDLPEAVYAELPPDAELLRWPQVLAALPPRQRNVNKGNYGHVLAIGGDAGMAGAIRLAGEAALRSGAGLVSIATRAEHVAALNATRPELMARGVDGPQDSKPMLARASVVAVGPGLGLRAWGHAHWRNALGFVGPRVIDADGLNLLAREPCTFGGTAVLTPHPGEAARLLGSDVARVQADRFATVRELAARYAAVVVLKGAGTLIGAPDGRVALCPWGNPHMASGGMGDVLTGVVAGLLAQHLSPWDAACLGVAVHARAGDLAAADGAGVLASDLYAPLRQLLGAGGRT